jgi:aryl-alcohol dehydrogenase-like predicted oxidoreductase
METRSLCPGGPEVSLVGLGCNNFGGRIDFDATRKVIDRAIEQGINHFDIADVYGGTRSEDFIGQILGDRRKRVVLATKFGMQADAVPGTRGSAAYVRRSAEASLKRLRTDWIDLYYLHQPDPQTPIAETLGALDELVKAGKVRHIAASNFSAEQTNEAVATAKRLGIAGFVVAQDEYSLLQRSIETALLPTLTANGINLVPFFPLAGGALTGKYRHNAPLPAGARHSKAGGSKHFLDPHWQTIERLRTFAETRGHTLLELAMSWIARRPRVVSVIAGATRPEQIDANVKAIGWDISAAERAEIDAITAAG